MEIKFENVSYIYHANSPLAKVALNNLNVVFEDNKIHGLIGPSGSGKTTLVELINGLSFPTEGTIKIGNDILNKKISKEVLSKIRFNVGLVFQFPEEQFFNSTVEDEISFALKNYKHKLKRIDKRVNDALKMVGLSSKYLTLNPFYLSSNEKRRIAIASVLIYNPKVIILDEPTVGLDNKGKKYFIKLIKKLKNDYHKTIIVCTHDVDMLYQIADDVVALNNGEIILSGDKNEVFNEVDLLDSHNIEVPKIVKFIHKVRITKGIKLDDSKDVKDLIKDVYRSV